MSSAPSTPASPAPGQRSHSQIFLYFGSLTLLVYFVLPHGGYLDIPTTYMLKNQLHKDADTISAFRFWSALPVYVGFFVGMTRDRWNPLGMRDRGFFLIFAPLTALAYVWLIFAPLSYWSLLFWVGLVMFFFRFIAAGYQGLIGLVGQENLMSGRLATLWQVVAYVPIFLAFYIGGVLTGKPTYYTFLGCGILTLGLIGFAFWKPKAVFEGTYEQPRAKTSDFWTDIKRLFRHKAIYPAVLIMLLWNFAPGSQTPLQFYLTNDLHLPDQVYANYNTWFSIGFIPMFVIYGFLCKKFPLKKLLFWGTVIAVPQMIPLLFIHTAFGAESLGLLIGALGGIATGAYYDLAIRACPPGLQGTLLLAVDGGYLLAQRGSDILGSYIYGRGGPKGFLYCVIAITIVYALILPCIWLVPKYLMATTDGEPNPEDDAEVAAEVAA